MKKVKMVALRNLYYDGDRKEGEEFKAREDHAAAMTRVGSAKPAEPAKQKSYSRRDMRAED